MYDTPMATDHKSTILDSMAFALGVAGTRIARALDDALAPEDLSHRHAGVLAAVASGRAATQRDIATALGLAPSRVVTLIDDLDRRSAVRRVTDDADRRARRVELTAHGRELLSTAERTVGVIEAKLRAAWGPDYADGLDIVSALARNFSADQD